MKPEIRQKIIKGISIAGLIATAALFVYGIATGLFWDEEAIQSLLNRAGIWAPVAFLALHMLQIVVPVVPGGACLTVGVIVFGPWWGFFYNMIGICAGSTISFLLARRFGKPFLETLVEPEKYAKYENWLEKGKKFDLFFALAILVPMAPDDLLCMMAGLTKMSLKKFICILLICKPVTIVMYSLVALAIF